MSLLWGHEIKVYFLYLIKLANTIYTYNIHTNIYTQLIHIYIYSDAHIEIHVN